MKISYTYEILPCETHNASSFRKYEFNIINDSFLRVSSHAFQLVLEFGIWKAWTCAFPLESKWWFVTNNINDLTIIPPFKFLTSGQSYAVWKQHCLCSDVLKIFFFFTQNCSKCGSVFHKYWGTNLVKGRLVLFQNAYKLAIAPYGELLPTPTVL